MGAGLNCSESVQPQGKKHPGDDLINVRFGPLCGLKSDMSRGRRSANRDLTRCSKQLRYSIKNAMGRAMATSMHRIGICALMISRV
jgi:hypothetical protein